MYSKSHDSYPAFEEAKVFSAMKKCISASGKSVMFRELEWQRHQKTSLENIPGEIFSNFAKTNFTVPKTMSSVWRTNGPKCQDANYG